MLTIQAAALTDVGKKREHNEDSLLVAPELGLYAVADGMGGHAAGEVASRLALEVVKKHLEKHRPQLEKLAAQGGEEQVESTIALLEEAVQQACQEVFNQAQQDKSRHGMGTTMTMLLALGQGAFVAHVGDSRAYLVREGECHQLTVDHSLVNEQVRRGSLSKKDASRVTYRNVITRALGIQPRVKVDTLHLDILPGDRFLLCSDGLHGYLKDNEAQAILDKLPLDQAAQAFIDLANQRGGKDNISVVCLRVESDDLQAAEELRRRVEVLRKTELFRYLSFRELAQLMNRTYIRSAREQEVIIEENITGDEMFLLLDGRLEVTKGGHRLAELQAGAAFGEMALIDNAPRSATVKALDACRLLVIGRKQFYDLIRRDPVMGVKLLWSFLQILSGRLRSTDEQLKKAISESACQPVAPDWVVPLD